MRHRSLVCALLLGFMSGAALQAQEGNGEWLQDRGPRFLAVAANTNTKAPVDVARTQVLQRRISFDLNGVTLRDALAEISKRANLPIMYGYDVAPLERRVRVRAQEITVAGALTEVLMGTGVDVLLSADRRAALVKREPPAPADLPAPNGSIVGRVTDASSGAGITGASVMLEGTQLGTITDNTGRYRIAEVPAGTYRVMVQQVGYADAQQSVTVSQGEEATIDVALDVSALPLDEIVATGTAFETRVRTVPNPISVLTAHDIEQKQATNIVDLLRGEIPGVVAQWSGQNGFSSAIYVRGNASWSTGDYIKIYIDGVEVAHPSYISTIDPKSIERIEVIRGPQASAIYGSEASSGVLQVFTKKGHQGDRPRIDAQTSVGMIESEYKSNDTTPLTQDHSLQVSGGSEAFSYRAGTSYATVGEWVTGYGSKTLSFSGGLRMVHGALTAELSALWSDRDLEGAQSPIYWRYPPSPSCPWCGRPDLDYPNRDYVLTQNTMGLTLSYRATGRWHHTLTLGDDQNGFAHQQPAPTRLTPADTFVSLSNTEYRRRSIRYRTAYEAGLGSAITGRFTAGLDYWSYVVQGGSASSLLNAVGTVLPSEDTYADFINDGWWNAGYFGMVEFGLRDQFFLTLSTRVEDNPRVGEEYGRMVSPRVGASYARELGPVELKLRMQYGKGIRPPPEFARAGQVFSSRIYRPNPGIGPEEKVGWDAGVELYWGNNSLKLTRYQEQGKNLIQAVELDRTASPIISQYQNIGRVASEGWEVEGRVDMGPVMLKANYAYSANVILELSNQYSSNPNSDYRVGDRMLYVPTHSAGGTVTWRFLRGSASLNMSVVDEWRTWDSIAFYDYAFGGEPWHGSSRDYYAAYSEALWKWNLRAEQGITEQVTAFVRVDNVANNQVAGHFSSDVGPGRTTVLGLRVAIQ